MTLSQDYFDLLLLSYEEEVKGEAYFRELSLRFEEAEAKEALPYFIQIERITTKALLALISKYALAPRPRSWLTHAGQQEAREQDFANWRDFLRDLVKTYPDFIKTFQICHEIAPEQDKPVLKLLIQHEKALIDYAKMALAASTDYLQPLQDYLMQNKRLL